MKTTLLCGDCLEMLKTLNINKEKAVIVTDPPFNIGYHYDSYKDKMSEEKYYSFLKEIFSLLGCPYVVVHYPEEICKLSIVMGKAPERVVSWVYNSNTSKQHRDIAFFGIKPDMNQVRQPYKNPTDKRIKERIARGIGGGSYMIGGISIK